MRLGAVEIHGKRGNDQISDAEMKTGCGCIDEKETPEKRVAQRESKRIGDT